MTNAEYQEIVEKKFNNSLENIMYDLCIVKNVVASEGAGILDVPKNVFIYWRDRFRFGPLQYCADKSKRLNKERLEQYKDELQNFDFNRLFKYGDKQSFDGFREMLERKLELMKARKIIYNPDGLENISIEMNIMVVVQAISYLDSYLSGELNKMVEKEAQELNSAIKSEEI